MELGLSKLQAKIYLELLRMPNQTGYRIAQSLNEPVANTYKALEMLINKGVSIVDESGPKKKYAVLSIENFLNQIESSFTNKRKFIEDEFKKIKPSPAQHGIFKIENIGQLYEVAKAIIKNATDIIAIDSTSLPLETLKSYLELSAKKGVQVIVKTYREITITGCEIVYAEKNDLKLSEPPFQYFTITCPGYDYLSALLNIENESIIEAISSKSKYLSFMVYNGMFSEFALTKILSSLKDNMAPNNILDEWEGMSTIRPSKINATKSYFTSS